MKIDRIKGVDVPGDYLRPGPDRVSMVEANMLQVRKSVEDPPRDNDHQ